MTRLFFYLLAVFILCIGCTYAQVVYIPQDRDSFNLYDDAHMKHGFWFYEAGQGLDGFSHNEYGYYDNGKKQGLWTKYDNAGNLVSIESYSNDALNGESRYFDKGQLILKASFRGLDKSKAYDTVYVTDPESFEEYTVIVSTEYGTARHGTWLYYNGLTGKVIKKEEYQVGEKISSFEYYIDADSDKKAVEALNKSMPHNQSSKVIRHNNRKHRQSLIK